MGRFWRDLAEPILGLGDIGAWTRVGRKGMSCSDLEKLQQGNVLYTIGHSNHDEQEFVELLQTHGIDVLADVRSQPYSRYATHFSAESMRHVAEEAGIKYLFMGKELGGRPNGAEFYDQDGYVLYRRVAASLPFHEGLQRLQQAMADEGKN